MRQTKFKLVTNFSADRFLMHMIQQHTKLGTADILGFFYDLGKKVAEIGADNMVDKDNIRMRVEIHDFFPGTSVPFMLFINGREWDSHIKDKATIY